IRRRYDIDGDPWNRFQTQCRLWARRDRQDLKITRSRRDGKSAIIERQGVARVDFRLVVWLIGQSLKARVGSLAGANNEIAVGERGAVTLNNDFDFLVLVRKVCHLGARLET